jgi:hypothetical protein
MNKCRTNHFSEWRSAPSMEERLKRFEAAGFTILKPGENGGSYAIIGAPVPPESTSKPKDQTENNPPAVPDH